MINALSIRRYFAPIKIMYYSRSEKSAKRHAIQRVNRLRNYVEQSITNVKKSLLQFSSDLFGDKTSRNVDSDVPSIDTVSSKTDTTANKHFG